jgi:hypothetical protein
LATYIPAGTLVSLAPEVRASIEDALRHPEDFTSYEALRQWAARTHGVQIKHQTLYTLARTRKAKLTVARPSHTNTSDAIGTFQAPYRTPLPQVVPPANTSPVRCSAKTTAASAY